MLMIIIIIVKIGMLLMEQREKTNSAVHPLEAFIQYFNFQARYEHF